MRVTPYFSKVITILPDVSNSCLIPIVAGRVGGADGNGSEMVVDSEIAGTDSDELIGCAAIVMFLFIFVEVILAVVK